jgi:hypothetical protein
MICTLSLSFCVALIGAALVAQASTASAGEDSKPPMPTKDCMGLHYGGAVTEVTKDSITIQWPGEEKPKKFAASEILASGGFPTKDRPPLNGRPPQTVGPSDRYRLADVKVGDLVHIFYAHLGGLDICDNIHIIKRPGGRVPPLPEGAENLIAPSGRKLIAYHEYMNARWDLEDKGIPYPEKFGNQRRWPVAPMPRDLTNTGRISQ